MNISNEISPLRAPSSCPARHTAGVGSRPPKSAHAGSEANLRWRIRGWVRRLFVVIQRQFDFRVGRLDFEGVFARWLGSLRSLWPSRAEVFFHLGRPFCLLRHRPR